MAKDKLNANPKNIMSIIIIILMVILIGLVLAIGYYIFGGEQLAIGANNNPQQGSESEYSVILDEFVLNLKPENRTRSYVKTTIALVYTDEEYIELINANTNKLRDVIIAKLRNKTSVEILNNENTSKIKGELVSSLNASLKADIISDIYFIDLVIQ